MCASHSVTILHFPTFHIWISSSWTVAGLVELAFAWRMCICCSVVAVLRWRVSRMPGEAEASCRPVVQESNGRRWFQLWMALPGPGEQACGENGPGKCLTPPLTCRLCISKACEIQSDRDSVLSAAACTCTGSANPAPLQQEWHLEGCVRWLKFPPPLISFLVDALRRA